LDGRALELRSELGRVSTNGVRIYPTVRSQGNAERSHKLGWEKPSRAMGEHKAHSSKYLRVQMREVIVQRWRNFPVKKTSARKFKATLSAAGKTL